MPQQIIVVGAGVIGLTCALTLSEQGHPIKIIASHFPSDPLNSAYTSPWAGAHFRPAPSRSESDLKEYKLTRETLQYFKKIAAAEPESSIRFMDGVEFFEKPDKYYTNLSEGYTEDVDNFEVLAQDKLPKGVTMGTKYNTWVLNSPVYINYLQRKLTMRHGVEFIKADLNSLKQLFQIYPNSIIINATGQGLLYNGGYDPKSFPIRGQTLLVRPPPDCPYLYKTVTHQSADGLWTFVIPRPLDGGIIIGGTKQPNDLLSCPREEDTNALIDRAKILYPELLVDGEFDIRFVNVGFRPGREGGSRVEVEKINGKETIIHAYGAAGLGYELSYGVSLRVAELLDGVLAPKSKL